MNGSVFEKETWPEYTVYDTLKTGEELDCPQYGGKCKDGDGFFTNAKRNGWWGGESDTADKITYRKAQLSKLCVMGGCGFDDATGECTGTWRHWCESFPLGVTGMDRTLARCANIPRSLTYNELSCTRCHGTCEPSSTSPSFLDAAPAQQRVARATRRMCRAQCARPT